MLSNLLNTERLFTILFMVKVKHSQRMNESPLKAWILANINGKIICAHCNCLAGLSETCSHVAAICFAVSNISKSRETVSF